MNLSRNIGIGTEANPENAIFEVCLEFGIVRQGQRKCRFAHAWQPIERADCQIAPLAQLLAQQSQFLVASNEGAGWEQRNERIEQKSRCVREWSADPCVRPVLFTLQKPKVMRILPKQRP